VEVVHHRIGVPFGLELLLLLLLLLMLLLLLLLLLLLVAVEVVQPQELGIPGRVELAMGDV
jgi:hypothetical protein